MEGLFTSESVSEGHPDKVADLISDAVLDEILAQDSHARVDCQTVVKSNNVILTGEITTSASINTEEIVRKVVKEIGYDDPLLGFDGNTCKIISTLSRQSPDINQGISRQKQEDQGSGDQGMVFGYACKETDVLMPAPIMYAHQLVKRQAELRKSGRLSWIRPDAKSQVTLRYVNDKPVELDTVILSTQHSPDIDHTILVESVREEIIRPVFPKDWITRDTRFFINPTGRFVIGGPVGDSGFSGKKTAVDTYGSMARHGGGSFSGKDPTKVDRSGAYLARYIAKNIVSAGIATRFEIQLAYAIGIADPVGIYVETFGTGKIKDPKIIELIRKHFDLTPYGMIRTFKLLRPIYKATTNYGHFGKKNPEFYWEKIDKAEALRADSGIKD